MIASAINERMRRKLDYALKENRILREPDCASSPYLAYDQRLCEAELRATRGGFSVDVPQKYTEEDS
jgi:hypothetical protein